MGHLIRVLVLSQFAFQPGDLIFDLQYIEL